MSADVRMLAWQRVDGYGSSMARIERALAGWQCQAAEILTRPDEVLTCIATLRTTDDLARRGGLYDNVGFKLLGHEHIWELDNIDNIPRQ